MADQLDILIAGAGASGHTLALGLQKMHDGRDLKLGIVEANSAPKQVSKNAFDARAIALSAQSFEFLSGMGLANQLRDNTTAIKTIHVSDQGQIGQCSLHHADHHIPALGYVVELEALGQCLSDTLQHDLISQYQPDSIASINKTADQLEVTLASGREVTCKLLVVCDGQFSKTRQLLGIGHQQKPYQQSALIANVRMSQGHNNQAFERFTPSGPLALLPLGQDMMSLVWCLPPANIESYLTMAEPLFLDALQMAFGYRLGKFTAVSKRFSYPLQLVTSDQLTQHRSVVIGNAAQALHPIAGQGFNLGLRDIQGLLDVLQTALSSGSDIGSYATLSQYQKQRRNDRNNTVFMTDGLVNWFSNQDPVKCAMRNKGLLLLDGFKLAKNKFAQFAMGRR